MRESIHKLFLFSAVLLLWCFTPVRVGGQGGQATTLVIEGGTLIDGNGGAPVRDALIIIQGNKITNVSRKGQVSYPANAQVIQADGKFIVPGLWDSQVNYAWFWGEAMLANGVTSIVDIGNGEEVGIAYRDAVLHGKIRGPRTFIGIGHIGGARPGQMTGLETPLSTRQEPWPHAREPWACAVWERRCRSDPGDFRGNLQKVAGTAARAHCGACIFVGSNQRCRSWSPGVQGGSKEGRPARRNQREEDKKYWRH